MRLGLKLFTGGNNFAYSPYSQILDPPGTNQGRLTEVEGYVRKTSLYPFSLFRFSSHYFENIIYLFTKQPTLTRRSTVLSRPPQLVIPGCSIIDEEKTFYVTVTRTSTRRDKIGVAILRSLNAPLDLGNLDPRL
jgi:hypothetical protein